MHRLELQTTTRDRALALALPVLWALVAVVIVSFAWWIAVK
jgi:hypothetical protein